MGGVGSGGRADWPSSQPPLPRAPWGSPKAEVTIALIGGQRLLRDATASLLASEDGLRMLGTFECADHFLEAGIEELPAVLLLDCDEDEPACWQNAIGRLSSAQVRCGVVMLCGAMREEAIRCALEQRVNGVILKSYPTQQIRESIAYVATGRTVMPAGWQLALTSGWKKPLGLSPRHRQVLALMAQGQCNDQIATTLELSPNTVKFHIRALYERLGVHNRVEAANRYAQMPSGDA
jgi:DNA-binding NarL/FixJ family response regulator